MKPQEMGTTGLVDWVLGTIEADFHQKQRTEATLMYGRYRESLRVLRARHGRDCRSEFTRACYAKETNHSIRVRLRQWGRLEVVSSGPVDSPMMAMLRERT